jgi:hypothetical protein
MQVQGCGDDVDLLLHQETEVSQAWMGSAAALEAIPSSDEGRDQIR